MTLKLKYIICKKMLISKIKYSRTKKNYKIGYNYKVTSNLDFELDVTWPNWLYLNLDFKADLI